MNLFEAKHILQSVGYTVNKDYAGEACAILESAVRKLSKSGMLSEMSKARADKAETPEAKRLEQDMASIDSKKSNYENGKAKSAEMANAGSYIADYEELKAIEDTLSARDAETLRIFEDDGYLAACENNDATLVKKTDKGNGAGEGGNFAAALANGDVKRALTVIMNRIRSGFASDDAKERCLAALDQIAEMDGAEVVMDKIESAREKLGALELGARARRAADTYTAIYDENVKLGVLKALLVKAGVKEAPIVDEENMSITFAASPTVAAKATEILASRFGMEVTKNERQSAAAAAKETKTIIVDDPEIAEVGLDDDEFAGKYTFGEDGEITLTGTAKQIAKMIAAIEGVGGEIIG